MILLVTCSWGLNYPIMKFVVTEYPPSSFRALTFILGTCVLGVYARSRGESLWVPPEERWTTLRLSIPNMVLWHVGLVYGISLLNSGRAAIIGYTMPVWALLASVLLYRSPHRFLFLLLITVPSRLILLHSSSCAYSSTLFFI